MNIEIAKKWCKALKSNDYKQTTDVLRIKNSHGNYCYCCLGVLCDLYSKEKDINYDDINFDHGEHLPSEVQSWASMKDNCGSIGYDNLILLNDNGCDFQEIADFIDDNIENL